MKLRVTGGADEYEPRQTGVHQFDISKLKCFQLIIIAPFIEISLLTVCGMQLSREKLVSNSQSLGKFKKKKTLQKSVGT